MTFPALRTGAVAQYPFGADRVLHPVRTVSGRKPAEVPNFADGPAALDNQLDLLDEQELSALIDFVEAQGSDAFRVHRSGHRRHGARCVIAGEQFDAAMTGEITARHRS